MALFVVVLCWVEVCVESFSPFIFCMTLNFSSACFYQCYGAYVVPLNNLTSVFLRTIFLRLKSKFPGVFHITTIRFIIHLLIFSNFQIYLLPYFSLFLLYFYPSFPLTHPSLLFAHNVILGKSTFSPYYNTSVAFIWCKMHRRLCIHLALL